MNTITCTARVAKRKRAIVRHFLTRLPPRYLLLSPPSQSVSQERKNSAAVDRVPFHLRTMKRIGLIRLAGRRVVLQAFHRQPILFPFPPIGASEDRNLT